MRPPNEINPVQLARILALQEEIALEIAGRTGQPIDVRCAEVRIRVCEAILGEKGAQWRAEYDRGAG